MKQITEDYVSFEIAQLLKEKGFDGECRMTYREHDMQMIYYTPNPNDLLDFTTNRKKLETLSKKNHCEYCLCPTHQMALKWLREAHKINIVIGVASDDDNLYSLWKFDIWNGNYSIIWGDKREKFNSYEQAVKAALKYTLENLI